MTIKNDLFLRACRGEQTERTPIWMMRQAGRYLPEYRAIRVNHGFLAMCKTPELAAEITVQPIYIVGVDAAILFSDILVIPEAMGMELTIEEGSGPRLSPAITSEADIDRLIIPDPTDKLRYVLDAVVETKRALAGRVPLIGFAGAPWTLFSYMLEGHGTKDFILAKKFAFSETRAAHKLLQKITDSVIQYLLAKIEAGCNAVQIFDTWGGLLSHADFREFSLPYIRQIVSEVKKATNGTIPVIVFVKGGWHASEDIVATGCDVMGLDWTVDFGKAKHQFGEKTALQGNLDPIILLSTPEKIVNSAREILTAGAKKGHIFNLGHGILPSTPVEHAKLLVETVKNF